MEGDITFGFFANDGFFLETPDGFHYRSIPHVLMHTIHNDAAKGLWLTTGINNSYSYRYIAKGGGTYAAWRNCPTGLQAELDVPKPKAKVIKASLGPDRDDFFLLRRDGSSAWAAPSPVVQWMRAQKARLGSPQLVVFGPENSAVAVFDDEIVTKDVSDDLHSVLMESKSPIRFITLSPHNRDHYFVQFENHSVAYSVAAATYEEIREPLDAATKVYTHATFKTSGASEGSEGSNLPPIDDFEEEDGAYIHIKQDGDAPQAGTPSDRPASGYFDQPARPKVSRHSTRQSRLGTQYFSPPPAGSLPRTPLSYEDEDVKKLAPSGSPMVRPLLSPAASGRPATEKRSSSFFGSRPKNEKRTSSSGWEAAAKVARSPPPDGGPRMVSDATKNPWLKRRTSENKRK